MSSVVLANFAENPALPCGCNGHDRISAFHRRYTRLGAFGLLVVGVILAHLPSGVGIPCPVLLLTGVPCPFCGLTTSVRNLSGFRFREAAAANPFGFLVVAASLAVIVLPWSTWKRLVSRLGRTAIFLAIGGLASWSWLFELARYHVV